MSEGGPSLSEVAVVPKPPAPGEESVPSPEQTEVDKQRGIAVVIIRGVQDKGIFTTPQTRSAADFAVDSSGQDTKAVLAALRAIGDYVADGSKDAPFVAKSYNALSETFEIESGGKKYKLSELETERSDPNTTPDRKAEIERIIEKGLTVELSPQERLNLALDQNITYLQSQIAERKANKQPTEAYEEILKGLKIAQGFEGNTKAFFQVAALRRLRASGLSQDPANLDQAINGSSEVYNKAQEALIVNALDQGYTPEQAKFIVDTLNREDFAELKRVGFFSKPGVDKLLFGKEMTDAEMAKLLGLLGEKRKFGKDEALMVLLMALVGVTQATRQAVMGEFKR